MPYEEKAEVHDLYSLSLNPVQKAEDSIHGKNHQTILFKDNSG